MKPSSTGCLLFIWCSHTDVHIYVSDLPIASQMSSSSTHPFAFNNYWKIGTLAVPCLLEDWCCIRILPRFLFCQISIWLTLLSPLGLDLNTYFLRSFLTTLFSVIMFPTCHSLSTFPTLFSPIALITISHPTVYLYICFLSIN